MSFTPAGGGGWTKFVRGALDAAQTVGELIEVSKSALRLANGEGDLDDLVTLGIAGAGLGAGGLPGKGKGGDPGNSGISPRTPVGRSGQQTHFPNPNAPQPRNAPTTINGRDFSGHAIDRMQERGFTPSVVENAIQHGTPSAGNSPNTTVFTDKVNNIRVITNSETGRVITVIGGSK